MTGILPQSHVVPGALGHLTSLSLFCSWVKGTTILESIKWDRTSRAQTQALAHTSCTLIWGPPFSPALTTTNAQGCRFAQLHGTRTTGEVAARLKVPLLSFLPLLCGLDSIFKPLSSPPRTLPVPPPTKSKAHLPEIVGKALGIPGQDLGAEGHIPQRHGCSPRRKLKSWVWALHPWTENFKSRVWRCPWVFQFPVTLWNSLVGANVFSAVTRSQKATSSSANKYGLFSENDSASFLYHFLCWALNK